MPTTTSSLAVARPDPDPKFKTFLDIFDNPSTPTRRRSRRWATATSSSLQSFLAKWQAGKVNDLAAGLADVDNQIDAQLEQATGGGAP